MLRYLTAGESHGKTLIALVDGFPAGVTVDVESINVELRRRQGGYGRGGRQRIETGARATGISIDAVDEAVRAGLFVETATPAGAPAYDFTYAAMAHLAGERITAARRRLLHGRAADAMTRQSRPAAALLAHHLHEAGRDAEAAEWHWRAALEARSECRMRSCARASSTMSRASGVAPPLSSARDTSECMRIVDTVIRLRMIANPASHAATVANCWCVFGYLSAATAPPET